MLWLAVHLPHLALEVVAQALFTAPVAAQPLVILLHNRVYMRNASAVEQGIALDTTLATAHSVAPDLAHAERDPQLELERLHTVGNVLYQFSSHVSLQAPDCILLEVGRSVKLFGDHQTIQAEVLHLCRALGHQAVCRTAATPWAAIALSRAQTNELQDVNLGLAGLELAGIHPDIVERFNNMGIYTLGPVMALPDKQLARRFGKPLLTYLKQLTGILPDPREAMEPAPDFSMSLHLLEPVTRKTDFHAAAQSPMMILLRTLQQWLITHQLGCEALRWQFAGRHDVLLDVHFARARQSCDDLLRITLLRLERTELPDEVLGVSLTATRLQAWNNQSQGLFGPSSSESQAQSQPSQASSPLTPDAYELMDEFRARLGDDTCHGLQAIPQHTPENAWHAVQGYALSKASRAPSAKRSTHAQPVTSYTETLRPLWLFELPYPVQRHELTLLHGPERVQSNWWQQTISRDYYIAQHRQGAQCWAYVDANADWFLHGYFS